MKTKNVVLILLSILIAFSMNSCSSKNAETDDSTNVSIEINYIGVATQEDLEKPHADCALLDVIELKKDNYYLIKIICKFTNYSSKYMTSLDFEDYKDETIIYEHYGIDIEPSLDIAPNEYISREAYMYINDNIKDEQEIIKTLNNAEINFSLWTYDRDNGEVPYEGKGITVKGEYNENLKPEIHC